MELDRILLLVAVASCLFLLGGLARNRFAGTPGWAAVSLLVLAVAGAGYVVVPDRIGWIAAAMWLILLVVPLRLSHLVVRRIVEQRFAAARAYATIGRILHPFDGMWTTPLLIDALEIAHQGKTDEAVARLTRLEKDRRVSASMAILIRAQMARLLGDWSVVAALIDRAGKPERRALGTVHLRALGETGRLHELVAAFGALRQTEGMDHQFGLLFLFAFCGRRAAVEYLFAGPLAAVDSDTKTFWLATADRVRGDAAARARFEQLAASDRPVRRAARQRLDVPLARPALLGPADLRVVDDAEAGMRRDAHFRETRQQMLRCYVLYGIVVLNVAGFVLEEVEGGSESARVLYRLGALWPPAVIDQAEWWRLATATFLHFGPVHLILNMAALIVFGMWVEWLVGHWRFALIYLGSAVGSTVAVLVLMRQGVVALGLLAGASGAIFGVIGAQVVLLALGSQRLKSRLAGRRLLGMAFVIALQIVYDLTTPQVSFAAHACGFVIGAGLMAGLALVTRWPADT